MFWKANSTLLASKADVSMNERLFSPRQDQQSQPDTMSTLTGKLLGFLCGHSAQVSQITLVSNQHDDNVCIGMISKLFQPSRDIVVGLVFADVVDEQSTNSASVVGRCDGTVSFLTGSIPYLSLDCFGVNLDGSGREFDADGGFRIEIEFVARETAEKIGLSNARVSDQDHLE